MHKYVCMNVYAWICMHICMHESKYIHENRFCVDIPHVCWMTLSVAVCWECVALCCSVSRVCCSVLQCVESVLQCVAVRCSITRHTTRMLMDSVSLFVDMIYLFWRSHVLQCVESVLQCCAVCCSVLQWVKSVLRVCCSELLHCPIIIIYVNGFYLSFRGDTITHLAERWVAVRCSVLWVCCSVLQCVAVSCSVLRVCCSVLQCVATSPDIQHLCWWILRLFSWRHYNSFRGTVSCNVLQRVALCCSVCWNIY